MAETQLRGRDLAGTSIDPRICTACKMQVHLPSIEQSLVHLSRLGILSTRPIHERNGEGRYYYLAQHGSFLGGKIPSPFQHHHRALTYAAEVPKLLCMAMAGGGVDSRITHPSKSVSHS
ncbi:predicted protein [Histoplasma capsulatum var. duboisii H88]|uniref:Predicted protein n=1 Tax=Ajellomyces capsulatus (strain H88) TaxID=544711 RepID=F0U8H9_AJEC8|nr:predicted protein [Histoplasma capsulatum var. duboisii H88]